MKTNDLIQLGALGLVAYLAYKKFASAQPTSIPSLPVQPSTQLPDFGVTNPNDPTWGDPNAALQAVVDGVFGA